MPSTTTVAGISVPTSDLAREADALSRAALPPQIYAHCLRTYYFSELVAKAQGTAHDQELVFVASILHDVGLSQKHMSDHNRFEVDGALAARELLKKHGVSHASSELVWDAITLHDSTGLAKWKAPEVVLVNAGVNTDFGGYQDILKHSDILEVLQHVPRTGFIDAFLPAVAAVAKRKPNATGNCFVVDVGNRLVEGFHLPNFCDAVRDDPFADLTKA